MSDTSTATARDSAGVLRTATGDLHPGRFATELANESGIGVTRVDKVAARALELEQVYKEARTRMLAANAAAIEARNAGWDMASGDNYVSYVRLNQVLALTRLDTDRAMWDQRQFQLENAREVLAASGFGTPMDTYQHLLVSQPVGPERSAQIYVLSEMDEDIALAHLKTWDGVRALSHANGHPARYIFLDHESDKVRVAAVRAGVAGTNPVTLIEILSVYQNNTQVTSAARAALSKNGYPGRAAHEDNFVAFGDTLLSKTSGHRTYARRKLKPNTMPGKIGPVYPD